MGRVNHEESSESSIGAARARARTSRNQNDEKNLENENLSCNPLFSQQSRLYKSFRIKRKKIKKKIERRNN